MKYINQSATRYGKFVIFNKGGMNLTEGMGNKIEEVTSAPGAAAESAAKTVSMAADTVTNAATGGAKSLMDKAIKPDVVGK